MGKFTNNIKVEWVETGKRDMILLEDVAYIDGAGRTWTACAGDRIDGASIPRILWRVIGSPFIGHYRRASVIHDVYCIKKTMPYYEVHQVFDEMMRDDKVPPWKRRMMAQAVKRFGPKWITVLDNSQ